MRSADRVELVALTRLAGLFATHQRDYADALDAATAESLDIAREAGVPVQIAHLQMNGDANVGRAPELLAALDRARLDGVDVTCDTYPYTAGSTVVQSLLPPWAVDGGPEIILRRLSAAGDRARMSAALASKQEGGKPIDWTRFALAGATSAANAPYEGETFARAAAARGMSVPDWILCLLEEEELRACFIQHAAHEGNVKDILRWPGQMIGSDGLHLAGKTHPRLYGTFPRVLAKYVREETVIPLESAIHKMTGMPAQRLGLRDRGTIAPGSAADIVVFDPARVADAATFDTPDRFPVGIPYVLVNGHAVKWADAPTHALPGAILRR
jgi:N-acyl-D-aspartate/D-glutamate deacylase